MNYETKIKTLEELNDDFKNDNEFSFEGNKAKEYLDEKAHDYARHFSRLNKLTPNQIRRFYHELQDLHQKVETKDKKLNEI